MANEGDGQSAGKTQKIPGFPARQLDALEQGTSDTVIMMVLRLCRSNAPNSNTSWLGVGQLVNSSGYRRNAVPILTR
jgi:hypothetical protein